MKGKRNSKAEVKTNNKIKTKNNKVTKKKKPQKPTIYDYKNFAVRKTVFSHGSVIINIPKSYVETLKLANSSVKIRVVGSKLVVTKISPRLD